MSLNNLGENLLRYTYKEKTFCCFDTETESLNLYYSRPWSIAWIISKGDNVIETHDRYLWWDDFNISKGAATITKFNYSEYKDRAEDPKKVFKEFEPILYDPNIINVAHNGIGLDYSQINSWRRCIGLNTDYSFLTGGFYYDTDCVEKAIKAGFSPQYPLYPWFCKLKSYIRKGLKTNLTLLAKEYGLTVDENKFHGALFDTEITRQVKLKQFWRIEIEI